MQLAAYILYVLLAWSGLFAGVLISYYSFAEVRCFQRMIPWLQLSLFALFFIGLSFSVPAHILFVLLFLSFMFIFFFWQKTTLNIADYVVVGALFLFTTLTSSLQSFFIVILFLLGICSGTIYVLLHRKDSSQKAINLQHHKHSQQHHTLPQLLRGALKTYYFFPLLALATLLISYLIKHFLL